MDKPTIVGVSLPRAEAASVIEIAAAHWNAKAYSTRPALWFQHEAIVRHVNTRTCGTPVDGVSAGVRRLLRDRAGQKFPRGISVGCGSTFKELQLVKDGLVDAFDLYEISANRLDTARRMWSREGLSDRCRFSLGDAFSMAEPGYDLVHWDASLHHMLDVREALLWSRRMLNPGGWMAINEYIGPSRFQWPDVVLAWTRRVRATLPKRYIADCTRPGHNVPVRIGRPTLADMLRLDPTEAADSDRIVSTASELFPKGSWRTLGGAVYEVALHNICGNFTDQDGEHWLANCLAIDDCLSALGVNLFGAFVAPVD